MPDGGHPAPAEHDGELRPPPAPRIGLGPKQHEHHHTFGPLRVEVDWPTWSVSADNAEALRREIERELQPMIGTEAERLSRAIMRLVLRRITEGA